MELNNKITLHLQGDFCIKIRAELLIPRVYSYTVSAFTRLFSKSWVQTVQASGILPNAQRAYRK